MRQSRWQWLSRFFAPKLESTGHKPTPRGKPGVVPLVAWRVLGCGSALEVKAATKSEARAVAKRELGIQGRLPVGVAIVRKDARRIAA